MLQVCTNYGKEYNVLFIPEKTKLIHIKNIKSNNIINITFMGKPITIVDNDKHLGYSVGNAKNDYIITQATNDFIARVNMVKSHFKLVSPDIMYTLFKTYCMPLYGCPLWDYSDKSICKFYVAWRKAVRSILRLPRTTHCSLLNEICNDLSIDDQLYSRFVHFFQSLLYNTNKLTTMCAKLALRGSNSNVSNNVLIATNKLARVNVAFVKPCTNMLLQHSISDSASIIRDLLYTRYNNLFMPKGTEFLSTDEVQYAIEYLCTE